LQPRGVFQLLQAQLRLRRLPGSRRDVPAPGARARPGQARGDPAPHPAADDRSRDVRAAHGPARPRRGRAARGRPHDQLDPRLSLARLRGRPPEELGPGRAILGAMLRRMGAPVLGVVVFWWIVFFLAQGADRAFLLRDAARLEPPTAGVLAVTLLAGARADLVVASLAILVALLLAGVMAAPWALASRQGGRRARDVFRVAFGTVCWALAVLCALVVTVDMAYYGYNRQHLDAVFFEYVDEMLSRGPASPGAAETPRASRQALEQTRAEIGEAGKWGARLAAFALVQAVVIFAWRWTFRRRVEPVLARWSARWPRASLVALGVGLVAGATGLDREGPLAIARVGIPSTTYYVLAQNPIWQTVDASLLAFGSDQQRARSRAEALMPLDEAIRLTRQTVAPGAVFPSDHYPLVRGAEPPAAGR